MLARVSGSVKTAKCDLTHKDVKLASRLVYTDELSPDGINCLENEPGKKDAESARGSWLP